MTKAKIVKLLIGFEGLLIIILIVLMVKSHG